MGAGQTRTTWQTATLVGISNETGSAKTFRLRLHQPTPHLAGQHYVIRLTAPDGYTASRSYSIASAPDGSAELDFTVERLDDGEVSTFLHDVAQPGDDLEVRGPIGGWFVWEGTTPVLLVGGGSGVVPLMAMLRLARRTGRAELVRLVVSVRTPDDLYYAAELPGPRPPSSTPAATRPARRAHPDGSSRPTFPPCPIERPPPTSVARPGSPTTPPTCSSIPASPQPPFASNASGPPAPPETAGGARRRSSELDLGVERVSGEEVVHPGARGPHDLLLEAELHE